MASFLEIQKTIVDGVGYINEGTRLAMELLDPQAKSQFEIIVYPQSFDLTNFKAIAMTAMDITINKLYVQTINIPAFNGFEYGSATEEKFIKGITYPEEISMTFIENEEGAVRQYLDTWYESIVTKGFPTLLSIQHAQNMTHVFKDNQLASKKDAKIFLQSGRQVPTNGLIDIKGLKLKNSGSVQIGHGEVDYLMIEATFAVDSIEWGTLF